MKSNFCEGARRGGEMGWAVTDNKYDKLQIRSYSEGTVLRGGGGAVTINYTIYRFCAKNCSDCSLKSRPTLVIHFYFL